MANNLIFGAVFLLGETESDKGSILELVNGASFGRKDCAPNFENYVVQKNGAESEVGEDRVCLPGRRRKKKPMMATSATACSNSVVAVAFKCCIIVKGIGFTLVAGGSDRA
jgi:hypothetical protein